MLLKIAHFEVGHINKMHVVGVSCMESVNLAWCSVLAEGMNSVNDIMKLGIVRHLIIESLWVKE